MSVNLIDLGIGLGSLGMVVFTLPALIHKKSEVPRWTSSVPLAAILTYFVPLFLMEGLVITATTVGGQAVMEWLIAVFRPIRKYKK